MKMMKIFSIPLLILICSIPAFAKTVTDQRGVSVQIPDNVNRIVSIPIPMASMIVTIDQSSQRLIGINRASHNDFVEGFLPKIYPDLANIPYDIAGDGFVPSVETLAKLHPDVVIQWGDMGEHIIKPLTDAGFPVVTTLYGETHFVTDWMRIIGEILGKEQRANMLINWFNQEYTQLQEKVNSYGKEKPGVIYLSRYQTGMVAAGKNNSFQGDIEIAGGINAASGIKGITPINVEQLILWNPQIILLSTFEKGLTPEVLYHDPRLKNVSAIINKRVYIYPRGGFRWDPPSQESTLALNWLAVLFHPQQFANDEGRKQFRNKVKQGFQLLYDYRLSDDEIDDILQIKENNVSADYCQLFCRDGGKS